MHIKLEILHPEDHQKLLYTPQNSYVHTAKRLMAPLLFSEFIAASRSYPIIFYLSEGDEKLTPMAMLGTDASEGNLSIGKHGRWLDGRMIPASLENYPFYTGPIDEKGDITLLIDINAPHFQPSPANLTSYSLFTASGEATPTLKTIRKKHLANQKELGHTDWIVSKLYEMNLFQAKKLHDFLPEKQFTQQHSFFILDQKKLEELPDEYFLGMRQQGLLTNLYALINSQNNFALLTKPAEQYLDPDPESWLEDIQKNQPTTEGKPSSKGAQPVIALIGVILLASLLIYYNLSSSKPISIAKQPAETATAKNTDSQKHQASVTELQQRDVVPPVIEKVVP
ncbi:MAG: SapC family protein, partial [Magnetococcales bacterium]|nr:SapC family protein [Magnetococcales bacterium]